VSEPTNECTRLCQYRERAWRAEAALDVRYGLREELRKALGVSDTYGDQALRDALRKIASLRRQAAYWKARAKAGKEGKR
jgi:hypothetical protein